MLPGATQAAITIGSVPGAAVYAGPTRAYDFETPAPLTGGLVTTGSVGGVRAQPFGSAGNYATVGPSDGSPANLNLSSFGGISTISLLWGSVDTYNTPQVMNGAVVLASFTGTAVSALANGNQTNPFTNPIVTLTFTGADRFAVDGLRFISTTNAFEFDNIAIAAVPEPATWGMLILGFGAIGAAMRRRSNVRTVLA